MRPIVIVGGGLAGLTLGVLLRREGTPVQLWEAGEYPRHRVCGEFISGRGKDLLSGLTLDTPLPSRCADTVRFFADQSGTAVLPLPEPGLCVSRWHLDQALAELFVCAGGELVTKRRWTDSFNREGVVRATGRRLEPGSSGWIGLKGHAQGLTLTADLEMHFSPLGYVGLCRLPDRVNICALVRSGWDISRFRADPAAIFRQLIHDKLDDIQFDPGSLCAVSGLSFRPFDLPDECCLGDAIRMISPFTGNGMSLAVESAALAAKPLLTYSHGETSWSEALTAIKQKCSKAFRARFAASAALRTLSDRSWTRSAMLSTLRTVPGLLSWCFRCTR